MIILIKKCNLSIVFRSFLGLITSFILFLIIYYKYIYLFKSSNIKNLIRLKNHFNIKKHNIPTMGGIIIIFSTILSILIWSNLYNMYVWYFIIFLISFGVIGFIDDYIKIYSKYDNGFNITNKYLIESIVIIFLLILIYIKKDIFILERIFIPFLNKKNIYINKYLYFLLRYFFLIITINSVNITDGLDGLSIISIIFSLLTIINILIIYSNTFLSNFFNVICIKNIDEVIILSFILIGSSLGFLWINSYPSDMFMGDTGSLSLGSILGLLFILLNNEILFVFSGGVFIIELISVLIQIISYKLYKKRIYLMAPIHHHYEIKGVHESKIVFRFSIISFLLNLVPLIILLIRINEF